ncbi:hypothetical protein CkaCkLH20_06544 [Colletotrichum karsti]|uniref:Uncharacterized protein n=1 Tax=Colletotrichum karsti TaxID=1095194 RepID=A0A9P6I2H6_9PEZI|nr:uncharacterized protein CkaCkLH20_06544 [Colletotrichum karsti]KAF9876098.1 hypothetical protein CkaCkLH20_06544 [Colletotrichum karsti]
MGSIKKTSKPTPIRSSRPSDDTSSTIARCGSPTRQTSKATKKAKSGHKKDKKDIKKKDAVEGYDIGSDLAYMGSQFEE